MKTKLPKQAERNENAGKVRDEPTGVANDLKDRVVGGFVHLVLVKGLSLVSERCVHVDQGSAVFVAFHLDQYVTLEIKGRFGALVKFVCYTKQLDGVRQVFPLAGEKLPTTSLCDE